jgi:hypothetical protein
LSIDATANTRLPHNEIHVRPYTEVVTMVNGGRIYDDGFVNALLGPGTYRVGATLSDLMEINFYTRPGEGIVHRVPEPGTLSLLVGGLLVLLGRSRTLRRANG